MTETGTLTFCLIMVNACCPPEEGSDEVAPVVAKGRAVIAVNTTSIANAAETSIRSNLPALPLFRLSPETRREKAVGDIYRLCNNVPGSNRA